MSGKNNPYVLLVWIYIVADTIENSMEMSQKIKKIDLSYNPAIPLLGIYPVKTKTLIQKDICTAMFIVTLFTISKIWKQPKCLLVDKWIKV